MHHELQYLRVDDHERGVALAAAQLSLQSGDPLPADVEAAVGEGQLALPAALAQVPGVEAADAHRLRSELDLSPVAVEQRGLATETLVDAHRRGIGVVQTQTSRGRQRGRHEVADDEERDREVCDRRGTLRTAIEVPIFGIGLGPDELILSFIDPKVLNRLF